jgi:hypothetical protein
MHILVPAYAINSCGPLFYIQHVEDWCVLPVGKVKYSRVQNSNKFKYN